MDNAPKATTTETISGLRPGDRIELVSMPDDPDPIAPGSLGTVTDVTAVGDLFGDGPYDQVAVDWDGGRGLSLVIPPDVVRKVSSAA